MSLRKAGLAAVAVADNQRYVALQWAELLRSERDEDKANGLSQLNELSDQLEGDEMWELCAESRESGLLVEIGKCVGSPEPALHQQALLLLATLTTEDVDPYADDTKWQIKKHHIFELIVPHLFSGVPLTVAFACAAVQNTVSDMVLTKYLQDSGGVTRLRELAKCDMAAIVQVCARD